MHSIAVVVTSCDRFYPTTSPVLLDSLRQALFPLEHVYIVVGESAEDKDDADARVFYRRYGNIDNNGLIWAASPSGRVHLAAYEWIFYMHDTCAVLPNFAPSLYMTLDVFGEKRLNALRIYSDFSMSMGYYKLSCVWSSLITGFLISLTNYDVSPDMMMCVKSSGNLEDVVFKRIQLLFPGTVHAIPNWRIQTSSDANEYGTTTKRLVEAMYFPSILKFKANHNVGPNEWTLNL
jgi:hypothetical protein